jgi:hypothetical protein
MTDQVSTFARKQELCAAIPMDLQEPLLEKSNEKSTKVHGQDEEDPSLAVVGSPVLANIESCSFLLGLMIAFFIESSALSAHILVLALFGDDADRGMVSLFSFTWSVLTSVLLFITFGFMRVLAVRHMYCLSGADPSEENETIIWHIECRFGLGTLLGINSASTLMGLFLGINGHIK